MDGPRRIPKIDEIGAGFITVGDDSGRPDLLI